MKLRKLSLSVAGFLLAAAASRASDQFPAYAIARSPDHPSTWVDGAMRDRQSLWWNPNKHVLYALVKYSTADFADATHPPQEDDFSLAFPSIHFDPPSNRFMTNGEVIATLHHGFFGSSVVLEPKWQLSIHRHHGVVYAGIIPRPRDD